MDPETLVDRALVAEAAGFVGIAGMDHLAPPLAETQPTFSAMTANTWLAAKTSRLVVGSLVLSDPFRHPAVLGPGGGFHRSLLERSLRVGNRLGLRPTRTWSLRGHNRARPGARSTAEGIARNYESSLDRRGGRLRRGVLPAPGRASGADTYRKDSARDRWRRSKDDGPRGRARRLVECARRDPRQGR